MFPIIFIRNQCGNDKSYYSKNECKGYISAKVCTKWEKRYKTHYIIYPYKEK